MARRRKNTPNPELRDAMLELRRGSRTSRHTLTKFKGSRKAQERRAIQDHS